MRVAITVHATNPANVGKWRRLSSSASRSQRSRGSSASAFSPLLPGDGDHLRHQLQIGGQSGDRDQRSRLGHVPPQCRASPRIPAEMDANWLASSLSTQDPPKLADVLGEGEVMVAIEYAFGQGKTDLALVFSASDLRPRLSELTGQEPWLGVQQPRRRQRVAHARWESAASRRERGLARCCCWAPDGCVGQRADQHVVVDGERAVGCECDEPCVRPGWAEPSLSPGLLVPAGRRRHRDVGRGVVGDQTAVRAPGGDPPRIVVHASRVMRPQPADAAIAR